MKRILDLGALSVLAQLVGACASGDAVGDAVGAGSTSERSATNPAETAATDPTSPNVPAQATTPPANVSNSVVTPMNVPVEPTTSSPTGTPPQVTTPGMSSATTPPVAATNPDTAAAGAPADTPEGGGGEPVVGTGGRAGDAGGTPNAGGSPDVGGGGSGVVGEAGASNLAGAPSTAPEDVCDPSGFSQVITVAASGGDFSTVQAAVDSVSTNNAEPVLVQIAPGTYKEKLVIEGRRFLTFCGESAESTTLTFDLNNEAAGGTSASASTTIDADDFSAVNITFENSRPIGSGQAVAILLRGERQQFLDCRFISFQDTLYVHHGTQYFRNCYVQGTVDYVFGGSAAVLEDCTMYNAGEGSAVAAPNTELAQPYGIVFLRGELTAAANIGADEIALARPWGADGSATFIETVLGAHVKKVGWVEMSGNPPGAARFAEYETSGPGASPGTRVAGSKQLTAEEAADYSVENVLDGWAPSFSARVEIATSPRLAAVRPNH